MIYNSYSMVTLGHTIVSSCRSSTGDEEDATKEARAPILTVAIEGEGGEGAKPRQKERLHYLDNIKSLHYSSGCAPLPGRLQRWFISGIRPGELQKPFPNLYFLDPSFEPMLVHVFLLLCLWVFHSIIAGQERTFKLPLREISKIRYSICSVHSPTGRVSTMGND